MYQEFFIGHSAQERCQKIDLSAFETVQQLRASLGRLFSFADPDCKFEHHNPYRHKEPTNR